MKRFLEKAVKWLLTAHIVVVVDGGDHHLEGGVFVSFRWVDVL